MTKVLWLAESYTPYNAFLFQTLYEIKDIDLKIIFRVKRDSFHYFPESSSYHFNFEHKHSFSFKLLSELLKSDFVFFTGIKSFNRKIYILFAVLLKKKFAFWTDTLPDSYFSGFKGLIKKMFYKFFAKRAHKICTTGVRGIDFFKRNSLNPEKLVNLPFFLDLNIPKISDNKINELENYFGKLISNGDFVICLSGKLIEFKRYDFAVMIANKIVNDFNIKNVKFLLCGAGPLKENLEKDIEHYKLKNNFFLLGWLDDEYLDYFHMKGNLFLHTALVDPFPTVVLKAMIYSLPIIGFEGAGSVTDRVINDYNGYIIKNGDLNNMIEKTLDLVKNPGKADKLGKNARETAEKWDKEKAVYIFKQIIS
jgi:glycosyltransferase involved in cell wall biosynthesis